MKISSALLFVLGLSALPLAAQTTLVADTFTDAVAAGTGNGSQVTNAPGTWTVFTAGATSPTGSFYTVADQRLGLRATEIASPGTDPAGSGSNTVAYRAFDNAASFTLGGLQVGDQLVLAFDLNLGAVTASAQAGAAAGGLSFGLLANGTNAANSSVFYAQFETTAAAGDALVSFRTRASSGFLATGGTIQGSTATVTRNSLLGDSAISLTLTKVTAENRFNVSLVQDGTTLLTAENLDLAAVSSLSAGGLAVRNFGTASSQQFVTSNLTLDNVNLSIVPVPEPSAYALLGAAGAFVLLVMRRRRVVA